LNVLLNLTKEYDIAKRIPFMAELVVSDAKNPINKRVIKIVITFDLMINEVTFNTIFKLYKNEKRFEQM